MMDTEDKYIDCGFYVVMAGEKPDERFRLTSRGMDDEAEGAVVSKAMDTHYTGEKPPVDGWVTFYYPDKLESGDPFKIGTIPFRSVEKDGLWFAFPDNEKGNKRPIWKWKNPDEDPHENLTLNPSIGLFGDKSFHCWIKNGEIEWT